MKLMGNVLIGWFREGVYCSCTLLYADDTVVYARTVILKQPPDNHGESCVDHFLTLAEARGGSSTKVTPVGGTNVAVAGEAKRGLFDWLPRRLLLTSCVHSNVSPPPAPLPPASWLRELAAPPRQQWQTAEPVVPPLSPC